MPLKRGSTQTVISGNIREMLHDVKSGDGKIGNYRPPNMKKARQVAAAAAYANARRRKKHPRTVIDSAPSPLDD